MFLWVWANRPAWRIWDKVGLQDFTFSHCDTRFTWTYTVTIGLQTAWAAFLDAITERHIFGSAHRRGIMTRKIGLGPDFCTMHLPPIIVLYMYRPTHVEVIVLTNKHTQPNCSSVLHYAIQRYNGYITTHTGRWANINVTVAGVMPHYCYRLLLSFGTMSLTTNYSFGGCASFSTTLPLRSFPFHFPTPPYNRFPCHFAVSPSHFVPEKQGSGEEILLC